MNRNTIIISSLVALAVLAMFFLLLKSKSTGSIISSIGNAVSPQPTTAELSSVTNYTGQPATADYTNYSGYFAV